MKTTKRKETMDELEGLTNILAGVYYAGHQGSAIDDVIERARRQVLELLQGYSVIPPDGVIVRGLSELSSVVE